ncbi:MAG: zinc ribbon domain-containing protein [Acidimicrobiales bacterium]
MPAYDYKCPECDTTFEARRPMAEASEPMSCPNGHAGARRLLSVFATVGGSSSSSVPAPAPMPRAGGHGCGGGMCGC